MKFPPLTLVMTTWITDEQRKQVAKLTVRSWKFFIFYEGELRLHIADDGSTIPVKIENFYHERFAEITYSRQERHGVGASLNAGFKQAFKVSPIVFYAVDDWQLTEPINLTPWVKLLLERDDVGIVRLGPPHPFLRGTIETMTDDWQGWGLRLDRYGPIVGHRPMLWHQRMIETYGWHKEDCSALACEKDYTEKVVNHSGPDVVMALPHKFFHRDQAEVPSTSHIDP